MHLNRNDHAKDNDTQGTSGEREHISNWSKQQGAIRNKGDWTPHTMMAQATVLKKLLVRPPEDTKYLPAVIRSGLNIKVRCN